MSVSQYISSVSYVGGKIQQLHWLLPLLPTDARVYCEPFGGGAAVLLNRQRSAVDVYNDISRNTTNLFRVLQDADNARAVAELLRMMPVHYADFMRFRTLDEVEEGFELAWRYYLKSRQSCFGIGSVRPAGWGVVLTFDHINVGPSSHISMWWKSIENIERVGERMRGVQVRRGPALDVIREYDAPDALFYLDPPYVMPSLEHTESGYYEDGKMGSRDHVELLDCLAGIQGRWLLSGYENEIYSERLASAYKFRPPSHRLTIVNTQGARGSPERQECVWANFALDALPLFSAAA